MIVFTSVFGLISVSGFIMGLVALIKNIAMEKATHSVQYVNAYDKVEELAEEWGLDDEQTKKINKGIAEEGLVI